MSTKTERRPKVGDEAWEVGWCAGVPTDENGDSDMDNADDRVRRFQTRDQALAFAREVFPKDFFGAVSITPVRFEPYDDDDAARLPYAGFWEAIGDTEHYEGE